jgi:SAM-dependent methyltransferase
LACACVSGQKPEYDFYREFRNVIVPQLRSQEPSISEDGIAQRYEAKLRAAGVGETEISRRLRLIRSNRDLLEKDYWNRFYLNPESNFNREPNGFLVEVVQARPPGAALDYGMGEGRNAIYLASLGWKVSGFDPADAAVALAQKRAKELGLTLDTSAVRDSEYEFGKERFDLILFSWSMPLVPVEKVLDSLKPGGIIVMECAADFVGRNGMLKMFDALQIVRYEIVPAKVDFYNRIDTGVLRMVAMKPRQGPRRTESGPKNDHCGRITPQLVCVVRKSASSPRDYSFQLGHAVSRP